MRGVVGSWPTIAISIGLTMQAGMGSVMKWYEVSFVNGGYTIILFFVSFAFPETPYFVLMNGTPEKTLEVLKKFRSSSYNVEAELEQMLEYKVSRSSVKPSIGGILMGLTRVMSGIAFSILILKYGRRTLALVSSLGVSVVCLALWVFLMYAEEKSVFPQLCYMAYIAFAGVGYYNLPILFIYELAPLQIRGILGSIGISILNVIIFGVSHSYPYAENALGFKYVILGFALASFIGSIYLYFFLPETGDLTLQEIEEYYNERRPTLTSQRRIVSMQAISRLNTDNMESRSLIKIRRFS
ncbi:unnamed protein product, partial [Iphiclides podalirius]